MQLGDEVDGILAIKNECITAFFRVWKNNYMKRPFAATVWREGSSYVSQCLEIDIASQGATEDEALENLREALELHFEPPQPTLRRTPATPD